MSNRYEWADVPASARGQIMSAAELREAAVDPHGLVGDVVGVAVATGSNGALLWGPRDRVIRWAEDVAARLRAGEAVLSAAAAFNEAAVLSGGPGLAPMVTVAGVQVVVRIDGRGRLVISADFDDADPVLGDPVPVIVRMSGTQVWAQGPGTAEHPHDSGDYSDVQ